MRTTLTLDEDVAQRTKKLAAKLKKPFKFVLNEALRKGLDQVEKPQKRRDYRSKALGQPARMPEREQGFKMLDFMTSGTHSLQG
jgi:hypothetical protein